MFFHGAGHLMVINSGRWHSHRSRLAKPPPTDRWLILLMDLLTTAMDDLGRGWTRQRSASPREQA